MSELLEEQLRSAFTVRLESVSPDRELRLRSFDYHPRGRRFPVWPTMAAATGGVAAGVAAFVISLSSGASVAFAGWTGTPSPPSTAALTTARAACGNVSVSSVLAAEQRGPFSAISFLRSGRPWECVTEDHQVLMLNKTAYPRTAKLVAAHVSLPLIHHSLFGEAGLRWIELLKREGRLYSDNTHFAATPREQQEQTDITLGPSSFVAASGKVGIGVTGVAFVLENGTHVNATVNNGWYLAWWPGNATPDQNVPIAMRVTTKAGTTTAPFSASTLSQLYRQNP